MKRGPKMKVRIEVTRTLGQLRYTIVVEVEGGNTTDVEAIANRRMSKIEVIEEARCATS